MPRTATRPLETLTKIAAQYLDGYLFIAYLLSRTAVPIVGEKHRAASAFMVTQDNRHNGMLVHKKKNVQ